MITKLKKNEIFVFGSNLNGEHLGGAAAQAHKSFGAEWGIGEGLTGQSYAFPTLDKKMKKVSLKALQKSKDKLYKCVKENPDKTFLLTKVGTGIACFEEEEIKQLFAGYKPINIKLPEDWNFKWKFLRTGLKSDYGNFKWKLNKWEKETDISICNRGFHCSDTILQALGYVKGEILAQVEVGGKSIIETDKSAWEEMRIVKAYNWTKKDSVALSIFAAELCIENFEKIFPNDKRPREAIEAAKKWLANPTKKNESAAWSAAESAARSAWSAAESAVIQKISNWLEERVNSLEEIN